jgi:hypothetical protein
MTRTTKARFRGFVQEDLVPLVADFDAAKAAGGSAPSDQI